MKQFVELTNLEDEKITINLHCVFKIKPSKEGCVISFAFMQGTNFVKIVVKENYETVKMLIKED